MGIVTKTLKDGSGNSFTGTFWDDGAGNLSPHPVIQGSLPGYAATPTFNLGALNGAATAAKQPALGTAGAPSTDVLTVQGAAAMTALKVDGSGVTQPVSAASLPLPSGAATAAKQHGFGTAGAANADVVTIQGVASMVAVKVDGSAVTQPVSGTFWQTTQPVSLAALPVLPAGSNVIGGVTQSGTWTVSIAASQTIAATQSGAWNAGINVGGSAVSTSNPVPTQAQLVTASSYNDTTTALTASATYSGSSRTPPTTAAYFNVMAFADQAGTLNVQYTPDSGTTWRTIATAALVASTGLILQVPCFAWPMRVQVVNGGSAQGVLNVSSSFTAS